MPADGPDINARQNALHDLIEAVHAADLEDEAVVEQLDHLNQAGHPDSRLKFAELGKPHQLERPLYVELRLTSRSGLPPLKVDVLEYFDDGCQFSVALPPDLEVRDGEAAEVRLPGPDHGPTDAVKCRVTRLEPGSMVQLAVLEITSGR